MSAIIKSEEKLSRRHFLSRGLAAAAGSFFVTHGLIDGQLPTALAQQAKVVDLTNLKTVFKGTLTTPTEATFKQAVYGGLWNRLLTTRSPQIVARVKDEADVSTIIKFAVENKMKVTVRGGGHSWCQTSVRNSGIMIDLTDLNQVISIDAPKRKAILQPVISNREAQAKFKPYDLAFPTGHCPQVKLSGYLLSGGMSWNQGVWGHGWENLDAIEMVNAKGEHIIASKTENPDYFWAACGSGPGMFAVATRYHVRLHPLPKAMAASVYYYSINDFAKVGDWLSEEAKKLPPSVELSMWILPAPKELKDKCADHKGKVCLVTASIFEDDFGQAQKAAAMLEKCPVIEKCLQKTVCEPTDFEKLFDASGALWPENLRNKVDSAFSNATVTEIIEVAREHTENAPSDLTVVMWAIFTGPNIPEPQKDAAFSMSSKLYGGSWTMWRTPTEDEANIAWHAKYMDLIEPLLNGHYIGESDIVGHPEYLKKAISGRNMEKIEELRKKHDPDGVFFNYRDGLS
jgi:FAD/FMN-containing dehydrogenase